EGAGVEEEVVVAGAAGQAREARLPPVVGVALVAVLLRAGQRREGDVEVVQDGRVGVGQPVLGVGDAGGLQVLAPVHAVDAPHGGVGRVAVAVVAQQAGAHRRLVQREVPYRRERAGEGVVHVRLAGALPQVAVVTGGAGAGAGGELLARGGADLHVGERERLLQVAGGLGPDAGGVRARGLGADRVQRVHQGAVRRGGKVRLGRDRIVG